MMVNDPAVGAPPRRDGRRAEAALLQVRELRISYGGTPVVDGVSFELAAGESLALLGASGSGKTRIALALAGLLDRAARVTGSIELEGRELVGLPEAELSRLRGPRIGLVFQDAQSSLNPHLTLGTQLAEPLMWHQGLTRAQAWREAAALLDAVRIAEPARRLQQYPHECSGGMRQRVLIALALACRPALLIADEPTTALDVTVQAQVLQLLAELRERHNLALLLISHDPGVVAQLCERALVLERGKAVEGGVGSPV